MPCSVLENMLRRIRLDSGTDRGYPEEGCPEGGHGVFEGLEPVSVDPSGVITSLEFVVLVVCGG